MPKAENPTLTITVHETARGGEYRACGEDGESCGELTWVNRGENVRVANHTYVPNALRGQGVAGQLVDRLIADAREQGFKIEPTCSYVVTAFQRNSEWADLRAR